MDNTLLKNHPSVKSYVMHGFMPTGENDTHIYGICPFCSHLQHKHINGSFYVNKESKNKSWDCKSCGKEGGFSIFLETVAEHFRQFTDIKSLIQLSKNREIKCSTLKEHIIYNTVINKFCLPVYNREGKVIDIRIYSKSFISTFGCKTGLFNVSSLQDNIDTVFIMEGEWDGLVMLEIFKTLNLNFSVVSLPGANIFKPDWIELFNKKTVYVLLDNDDAGEKGASKIFNFLRNVASKMVFIHWDSSLKRGYDIRDLYRDNKMSAKDTLDKINNTVGNYPAGIDIGFVEGDNDGKNSNADFEGSGLTALQVYKVYKENLHLPETDIIDFLYGSIIANRLEGLPIWSFIVAPSGLTKSEFIMSISKAQGIHTEDNLSIAGLVSGYTASGVDCSLVAVLNNKVLAMKDFTTILKSRIDQRDAIFAALRSIYDGDYKHRFGNVHRQYISKFGIIAGVTNKVEVFLENESALGERFIRFEMKIPGTYAEELEYIDRALSNVERQTEIRHILSEVGKNCLDYNFIDNVEISKDSLTKIKYSALWLSIMRGAIERDKYTKDILYKPFREIGTRPSIQIKKLLKGICMFKRKIQPGKSEFNLVRKLIKGSVPSRMNDILETCYRNSETAAYTPRAISRMIKLSEPVCDMVCKNLYALDVFEKQQLEMKVEYCISDNFLKVIKESGVYQ